MESDELDAADAFANVEQGLTGENRTQMLEYWQRAIDEIERIPDDGSGPDVFKSSDLPLARIKKVMKTDSDVKMIAAEAPVLFAKACDIFISELAMRAWIHAKENKRRTLQRSDIATAIQKSDVFDFLIDIVPREEAQSRRHRQNEESADVKAQPGSEHEPRAGDAAGRAEPLALGAPYGAQALEPASVGGAQHLLAEGLAPPAAGEVPPMAMDMALPENEQPNYSYTIEDGRKDISEFAYQLSDQFPVFRNI